MSYIEQLLELAEQDFDRGQFPMPPQLQEVLATLQVGALLELKLGRYARAYRSVQDCRRHTANLREICRRSPASDRRRRDEQAGRLDEAVKVQQLAEDLADHARRRVLAHPG